MSDLIDREKLLNSMFADDPKDYFGYIADFPSVDAVEVVRCGDCEYWKQIDPHFGECLRLPGEMMVIDENWFCADGERREENG